MAYIMLRRWSLLTCGVRNWASADSGLTVRPGHLCETRSSIKWEREEAGRFVGGVSVGAVLFDGLERLIAQRIFEPLGAGDGRVPGAGQGRAYLCIYCRKYARSWFRLVLTKQRCSSPWRTAPVPCKWRSSRDCTTPPSRHWCKCMRTL